MEMEPKQDEEGKQMLDNKHGGVDGSINSTIHLNVDELRKPQLPNEITSIMQMDFNVAMLQTTLPLT